MRNLEGCDFQVARHLEERIHNFVKRVEQRKTSLRMSVSFYTHVKEVGE